MRLTKMREDGFYELKKEQEIYGEENGIRLVQIVGKYEDIEDELGVSLATLIKIFKASCSGQTVFVKYDSDGDYERVIYKVCLSDDYNGVILKTIKGGALLSDYKFKDYGKTWALTKEELE